MKLPDLTLRDSWTGVSVERKHDGVVYIINKAGRMTRLTREEARAALDMLEKLLDETPEK